MVVLSERCLSRFVVKKFYSINWFCLVNSIGKWYALKNRGVPENDNGDMGP